MEVLVSAVLIRTTDHHTIRVPTKKRDKISLDTYILSKSCFFLKWSTLRLSSFPRTIPAAAADDDETMHRHIAKFGENTKRWHQRTPGLKILPLASLTIIATVAVGNVVVWVIAGVILVNTNTPLFLSFFFLFLRGGGSSLEYQRGKKEWRV